MRKRHALGSVTLAAILGAGVMTWAPLPKNPDAETLSAAANDYDAEIIRDEFGVPHIYGKRDVDTAFGLGFAHGEDDYDTLQTVVIAARGHLARYQGKDAAVTDFLVHFMGVWDKVDSRYTQEVPEDAKAMSRAFVAGLNLYASQNPDKVLPGVLPFTEQDVTAGFMFKTPLFYGFDSEILKLLGDERMEAVALDPMTDEAFHVGPKPLAERGSNGLAVSPQRSGDGHTRLFINSHQPLTGPVAWYEAQMVSEEGLDIQGGLFPGTPIVLCGFNKNLGWANTVSNPDLTDIYVIIRNPDNKMQYRLDDKWVDFEVKTARIDLKLFGPFAYKAKRKILHTVHGPVMETKHGDYAVKYAGMDEMRQVSQYVRMAKAEDMDSFLGAMSMNALPSINYVYADKDGNVGLIHNGQYPERKAGWDFQKYLPGDRSDLNWSKYRPFSQVPKLMNPQSGLIWNSNNDPAFATDGPDNLRHSDFPATMGLQTNMTNRAKRMLELTADPSELISRERLLAIKFDNRYAKGSIADRVVKDVLALDFSSEPDMAEAQAHLAKWDYATDMDSTHAALGVLTTLEATTEKYTGDVPPVPEQAFRNAVAYLDLHHSGITTVWGEVNRLSHGKVSAPISGAPDVLRAIYPLEFGDDGILKTNAGDSYIALVEWDENGNQSADVIQPFGSAILDETSPHYSDQVEMFAAEKFRKAYMNREEVLKNATAQYAPGKR